MSDGEALSHAPDMLLELDDAGRVLYATPSCLEVVGLTADRLVGCSLQEIFALGEIDDETSRVLMRGYSELSASDSPTTVCTRVRRTDGSWRWLETRSRAWRDASGSRRTVVIARDVTDRQETLETLRHSEGRFRLIAEATRDLVTETDARARFVYVNATVRDVLGYEPEELVGTRPLDLHHPDDVDAFLATLREGTPGQPIHVRPHRLQHRDGSWIWVEATGVIYLRSDGERRTLGVARDISARMAAEREQRTFEQRMSQAQKLEGLGVMAGGIAHDFNNLLTPILGDASLALHDLPGDSPLRERLERIRRAALRAAALTNQMLAYAGESLLQTEQIDVSQAVEEIAELLDTAASRRAAIRYDLARGLPAVEADRVQLSQVVMNLITNASEALREEGGRIFVRTGSSFANRARLGRMALGAALPEGEYVSLEVEDSGCGMSAETRERIFDPFFTTKFTGRGLGLATVLGIVRRHGGALSIRSAEGRGSLFRVLLPAREHASSSPAEAPPLVSDWRGEGTVLVVDDDEAVRELATETLERAGFSVIGAADGSQAVEVFRAHANEVELVLLDRTMPGMSGERALAEIRQIRSDARILLVSGYSRDRAELDASETAPAGFLQKPFLPDDLIAEVRKLIEGS